MTKTETTKYQCGCGKIYSSYPAFSSHKKNKHANHNQPGTTIPKPYNPKRGRPSFTLPQRERQSAYSNYSALTCIEVGLLKLEERFKGLLSSADDEANLNLIDSFMRCEEIAANKTALRLISSVRNFTEALVTHLNQKIGEVIVEYFISVTTFLLQNLSMEEISLNWDADLDESYFKIDSSLFNQYFQQKGQVEKIRQLSKRGEVPLELVLNLTVLLSEYLCVLNLATSSLAIKA